MSAAGLPPAAVAAARDAARALARVQGDGEDALLAQLAATAIRIGEAFLGQALIARGFEDVLPGDGAWHPLAGRPVSAVAGVTALPIGGAPSVLAVAGYAVDIGADGRGWVRIAAGGAERAAVSYTAGLAATWDALPEPIAQGVAMLAAHLFENRQGEAMPPAAVGALWRPFRTLRLTGTRA